MAKTNGPDLFLREDRIVGIIKIENMLTGRFLLVKSNDCIPDCGKIRFSLDLGTFSHKALQNDYTQTGLELFDISIAAEAGKEEDMDDLLRQQAAILMEKGKESY